MHHSHGVRIHVQALDSVEADQAVYCNAVACVDMKPRAKHFVAMKAGYPLEVMQCVGMSTPPGLWIVRDAATGKLGFCHTDDIMLNADDVKSLHHGGPLSPVPSLQSAGGTPMASPLKQPGDKKFERQVSVYFPDDDAKQQQTLADILYESTDDEGDGQEGSGQFDGQ